MTGKFRVLAESKHKFTVATVYVIHDDGPGTRTCVSLHLNNMETAPSTADDPVPESNHVVPNTSDRDLQELLNKHAPLFTGLAKHNKTQVELSNDDTVKPAVAKPPHRIPYHLRQKVENEIHEKKYQTMRQRTGYHQ